MGSVTGPQARTPRTHSQWVVGHTPTPAPTARGQRALAARPEGGQPGEGEPLTPDAPHNGGRHPPRVRFGIGLKKNQFFPIVFQKITDCSDYGPFK